MEPIYSDNFTVSDAQCDCFGRLKPSAILWFVQEIAGRHSDLLGIGWDALAARGIFWAIIRHRVRITRLPEKKESIRVKTWPMPTTRVSYPRAVVAYSQSGDVLFESCSLWVLMDMQERTMLLPGKSGVQVRGIERGCELPPPKSLAPADLPGRYTHTVAFTDLDANGHMNNCRYLDLAADLLDAEFHRAHPVRELLLGYVAEAREGDALAIQHGLEAQQLRLEIARDGHRIFCAQVDFG